MSESSYERIRSITDIRKARIIKQFGESKPLPPDSELSPVKHEHKKIRFAGAAVRMAITQPIDQELAKDKTPKVLIPGFMATLPAYKMLAEELAAQGYPTVRLAIPRHNGIRHLHPAHLKNGMRQHSQAILAVSREAERKLPSNPESFDYIGHSLGGLALAEFMAHDPNKVNSAVFMASTGLSKHGVHQMAGRLKNVLGDEIAPFIQSVERKDVPEFAVHSLRHIFTNPLYTAREGYHAIAADIRYPLVQARQHNIPVGALWFSEDTFFPQSEITDETRALFDASTTVFGNHLSPNQEARATSTELIALTESLLPTSYNHATTS